MRPTIIAGNWKMNGNKESIAKLLTGIRMGIDKDSQSEIMVFPPFPYLAETQQILQGSEITWGAQNVSQHHEGAYTGEVSFNMIKEFGCTAAIIGHSERRHQFGESNEMVAEKFTNLIRHGIKPILCIGETLSERNDGQAESTVQAQLDVVINSAGGINALDHCLIAYEPVWAIGTGMPATPEMAQEMHKFIRSYLATFDENVANHCPILYGGSVKADNAQQLLIQSDIDGALVGGASLDVEAFLGIISCSK